MELALSSVSTINIMQPLSSTMAAQRTCAKKGADVTSLSRLNVEQVMGTKHTTAATAAGK
jgi:hypothetical protein